MNDRNKQQRRLDGLRIVIVSPFEIDSARGNATTATRLARRIAALGAEVEIVCTKKPESDSKSTQHPNELRAALKKAHTDALIGIHAGHFSRALVEAGIDIHQGSKAAPALLLTIGGNELYEDLGIAPDSVTPGQVRPESWALFERADAVLVATEHQRQAALQKRAGGVFLIHRYPEVGFGPITVGAGEQSGSSLADALTQPQGDPAGPVLAWCGALRPQKRPEWILPIFKTVREAHPGARLLLAGPLPNDASGRALEAELIATLGILRLAPFAAGPGGSIGTMLAHVDLVLNTSRTEGMSNFLLESMHESVPVVAANSRGTASWVQDQARLFHDLESGRIATLELLDDTSAAKTLGAKGQQWVTAWASPEREAKALAEAIEESLRLQPRAPG